MVSRHWVGRVLVFSHCDAKRRRSIRCIQYSLRFSAWARVVNDASPWIRLAPRPCAGPNAISKTRSRAALWVL